MQVQYTKLTKEQEIEYTEKMRAGSIEHRNKIIESAIPLIIKTCKQYKSEGFVHILNNIKYFDPLRGALSTFIRLSLVGVNKQSMHQSQLIRLPRFYGGDTISIQNIQTLEGYDNDDSICTTDTDSFVDKEFVDYLTNDIHEMDMDLVRDYYIEGLSFSKISKKRDIYRNGVVEIIRQSITRLKEKAESCGIYRV